jgi:hypothetical protein
MLKEEVTQFEQHCHDCRTCAAILLRELAIMGTVRAAGRR